MFAGFLRKKVLRNGRRRFFSGAGIRREPSLRSVFGAFTLIELMLTVAIIGLLAAIALPKFANLVAKSREAAAKGSLGALRSAINILYIDRDQAYVSSTTAGWSNIPLWLVPRYIDAIPTAGLPHHHHGTGSDVLVLPGDPIDAYWDFTSPTPTPWFWQVDPPQTIWTGNVYINCTHTDTRGVTISLW